MSSEESIACLEEKAPDTDQKSPTRITWARPSEFLLNVAGYNVGLGNVWRFSYLCYKNGGGAFLIPYLLVAAFCGLPLLFQEVAMGQFTRHGCIRAWVPMMQGIGYSTLLLCIFFLIYFTVVMAWCIFYLVHSFTIGTLPWCTCDNWWNSDACVNTVSSQVYINNTIKSPNSSTPANASTSVEEFWNNYVLQKTDGLGDLGSLTNWRMVLCYVFSWLVCYACIVKGIKTTGKVAYVTVSFPYIIMAILLVRGLTLEGAVDGVLFYITPDLHRLVDSQVWLDGASQVLYSLGVCYGILYGYGSYNKASTDCYRMAFYSVAICCGSSICFGFVIFSFIGHMASETGKNVTEVTEGGPGLVFQVYPAAMSLLPVPQLWSAIFFLMLAFLAVDSQFAAVEGCMSLLEDIFPTFFRAKVDYKLRAVLCLFIMVLGIPLLFDGGIYIFELLNYYGSHGICILWIAFFEALAMGWIYGTDQFFEDVKSMLGYYPNIFFKYCYMFLTPFLTMAIFLFLCLKYKPLTLGSYVYPWWGNAIGWVLSASIICCVPTFGIRSMMQAKGTWRERWKQSTTRCSEEPVAADLPEYEKTAGTTI